MFVVAERRLLLLLLLLDNAEGCGGHPFLTDAGTYILLGMHVLKLHRPIHPSYGKNLIERAMQYIKGITECSDDCFSCRKEHCDLFPI